MKHPQIVSGNDLRQGHVVYLTAAGAWTRALAQAAVATDAASAAALLAAAQAQPQTTVGAALIDVALDGPTGGDRAPRPLHYREVFRSRGPSHRPELGRALEGSR